MRLLCNWLDFLKQIPCCLQELKVFFGQFALVDHALNKRIPPRSIKRAVCVEGTPSATNQQLTQIAFVAHVQHRTKQLSLAVAAVSNAKGVVKFIRPKLANRQINLVKQLNKLFNILILVNLVRDDCVLDWSPNVFRCWADSTWFLWAVKSSAPVLNALKHCASRHQVSNSLLILSQCLL